MAAKLNLDMQRPARGLMKFKRIRCACVLTAILALPGSLQAQSARPLVALILARTGIAAEDNQPAISAAQLAVDEINANGGLLGMPMVLKIIDNHSTPLGSKAAADQAVAMNAMAVIGAIWSSHSLPAATVLQRAQIPMITPTSSMPAVTRVGNYIFRVCFIDSFQGDVMARFAYEDLKARTAAVFKNINEEYSLNLASYFEQVFTRMGGQLLWSGNYAGNAVDFHDILTPAIASHPDIFFVPGYARDAGLLLKQARKLGFSGIVLGGDGWGTQIAEFAGDSLANTYYSTHWHPDVAFAANQHLKQLYEGRWGVRLPDDFRIPLTYDAFRILADAVRRSGSLAPAKIRDALACTKNFQGATGSITFDANRDPVNKEVSIIRFVKGRPVFVKSFSPNDAVKEPDETQKPAF
jgi:branched-chain amino acid transport system substrate-binding protein